MVQQQAPPQATCSSKVPKVEPYYNYKPLRDGWIRLLRIENASDGQASHGQASPVADLEKDLYVTIEDHSLESCPEYIALSYTWGHSTAVMDPTTVIFTSEPRCYPIYCEGRLLRATRNLRDALRRLRQGAYTRALSTYEQSEFEKDAIGNADLYWIDALCVDQDDLPERSTQVRLMSRIYGQARSCIVYLGEKDEYSNPALDAVQAFYEDKAIGRQISRREMGKVRDMVVRRVEALSKEQKMHSVYYWRGAIFRACGFCRR